MSIEDMPVQPSARDAVVVGERGGLKLNSVLVLRI